MEFNWDQIEADNQPRDHDEQGGHSLVLPPVNKPRINRRMKTIAELAAKGHTQSSVAKTLGVSRQRVNALAKTNNLKFSADNGKNPNWKKMTYRVGVYARQGCTPQEVASILQLNMQDVLDFANESYIEFRNQPNVMRELMG